MTNIWSPNNPGISGLRELTSTELLLIQQIGGLGDPNADRILFWDDSAGSYAYLTVGSGLSLTNTTITATAALDGSGTTNEITYWVDSDTLGALAVATYPSLAELAHVKGVTSAIQTQLNARATSAGALTQFVGNGNWKVWYSNGSGDVTELSLGADGTYLRSNGAASAPTFDAPAGSGDVSKVGTPANNQMAVWTGDGTLEGTSDFTYDGTSLNLITGKNFQIAGATILADSAGTTTLSNIDALDATTEATIEAAIDTLANLTSIQGRTVTLADAGADAILGWDDSESAYENLTQAEVLAVIGDSSATAKGVVELATDAETVTGTDTVRATTPANITAKMAAPGAIGGTTPSTGVFTTLTINTLAVLAENASIALDPTLSADGKYTGITRTGTAGATLAFGDLIYLAAADSRWELADADAASTSGDVILGMCVLAAAADGDPTTILLFGNIRADTAFPALTIGAPAYVGTTAGDIQTAQPSGTDDVIRRVGFALTADELFFNPSNDYITHT